jgi:hypothetical protein
MDGKLMAGETPKTRDYSQPLSDPLGIYRDLAAYLGTRNPFLGPLDQGFMGRSPKETYLGMPDTEVTPQANPAAVRAYTRNAPYMEEFMSSPQHMYNEIHRLQVRLSKNPDDIVDQYRLRIMQNALGDVFGMQLPGGYADLYGRPQAPVTPGSESGAVTPRQR